MAPYNDHIVVNSVLRDVMSAADNPVADKPAADKKKGHRGYYGGNGKVINWETSLNDYINQARSV